MGVGCEVLLLLWKDFMLPDELQFLMFKFAKIALFSWVILLIIYKK